MNILIKIVSHWLSLAEQLLFSFREYKMYIFTNSYTQSETIIAISRRCFIKRFVVKKRCHWHHLTAPQWTRNTQPAATSELILLAGNYMTDSRLSQSSKAWTVFSPNKIHRGRVLNDSESERGTNYTVLLGSSTGDMCGEYATENYLFMSYLQW